MPTTHTAVERLAATTAMLAAAEPAQPARPTAAPPAQPAESDERYYAVWRLRHQTFMQMALKPHGNGLVSRGGDLLPQGVGHRPT